MADIIFFPEDGRRWRAPYGTLDEVQRIGRVGDFIVMTARRNDIEDKLIHLVIVGPSPVFTEVLNSMGDDDFGHHIAELAGEACFVALRMAHTVFDFAREADGCPAA